MRDKNNKLSIYKTDLSLYTGFKNMNDVIPSTFRDYIENKS